VCVCACVTGAILDPFAGAGTTLIEAMVAGRAALGCDISPLTVGVARAHCWLPTDAALDELRCAMVSIIAALQSQEEGAVEGAAEGAPPAAIDFSHARAVVSATLDAAGASEVVAAAAWFLLSHEEVYKWPDWRKVCVPLSLDASQACLLTAPSGCMHLLTAHPLAILCVDSRALLCSRFCSQPRPLSWRLSRTTSRYMTQLAALRRAVPAGTPGARIELADAREIPSAFRQFRPIDGVLTSPPYPGVYNYLEFTPAQSGLAAHIERTSSTHEHAISAREIGAKADKDDLAAERTHASFEDLWQADTVAWLQAAAAVLSPAGRIAILIGDDSGINTLESITNAAATISRNASSPYTLHVLASASLSSQATRPWAKQATRGRGYRREHTILLEKKVDARRE
jgi:hypothetical protein